MSHTLDSEKKRFHGEYASEWFDTLRTEMKGESDRSVVILSAAIFDEVLSKLLSDYFTVSHKSDDLFNGSNAPLSSFSAKILISFRLGLISEQFYRDLNLIRKIRNEFAHNIFNCSFQSERVISRVRDLFSRTDETLKTRARCKFEEGIKGDYVFVISWMLYSLNILREMVDNIDEQSLEFGYRNNE